MVWRLAIYCGRFQPPHQGHLKSVEYGLKIAKRVCIGIRATELSIKDPLTPKERVEIWKRLLKYKGVLNRVIIKIIPDFSKDYGIPQEDKIVLVGHPLLRWAKTVEETFEASPEDSVFIGNKPPMVVAFNLLGYIVVPGHRNAHRLVDVSATQLRKMIIGGDEKWKSVLPKPVVDYLVELGIRKRLLSFNNSRL